MYAEKPVEWHGTEAEATALAEAVARNCACQFGMGGFLTTRCSAHRMLLDQRALDGLVAVRRMAQMFIDKEFTADVNW